MADLRQPHERGTVDLSLPFKRLLASTLNDHHQLTAPSPLIHTLQNLLANRPAVPPDSAANLGLISDGTSPGSALNPVAITEDNDPPSSLKSQLPGLLHHQHSSTGFENAAAAVYSHSTSTQPRPISTPDPLSTPDTPPSSGSSTISQWSEPSRTIICSNCKQIGHTFREHCHKCNATDHVASDHCLLCGLLGHDHFAHCIQCHRVGDCTVGYCANAHCKKCGEIGHHASQHCARCKLAPHSVSDHCQVCDLVGCRADNHCNVCEDVGHTSRDHCGLCRELGHTENHHCIKCTQLGHGFFQCLESDPVSVELCWTCRSFGHNRDRCRYRHQDELRSKWAYQLKRRVMHADDYCKCCRAQGNPADRHKFVDCPKMTHRVGCLEKTHVSQKCIEWMKRSRPEGSYKDASTQADLADYSTDIDPRTVNKDEDSTTIAKLRPPPNIFTVTSVSTQTAFVEVGVDPSDLVDEPLRALREQPLIDQTVTTPVRQERTHQNAAMCDPDRSRVRHVPSPGRPAGLPNNLQDNNQDDPIKEEDRLTDSRRATQSLPNQQQDTLEHALTRDRQTTISQSSLFNRRDRQSNPSPEVKTNTRTESKIFFKGVSYSSAGRTINEDDSSDDLEIVSDDEFLARPRFFCADSPIRSMTSIREETVPPYLLRHALKMDEDVACSDVGCSAASRTTNDVPNEQVSSQNVRKTPEDSGLTVSTKRPMNPKSSKIPVEKRQKMNTNVELNSSDALEGKPYSELDKGVWLNRELHIPWKELCYMVILKAPNHSTNSNQLYNLVTNWLRNGFPLFTSIHYRANKKYLEKIMQTSPHIESRRSDQTSKITNPVEFSIRKDALATVETGVSAFEKKFAQLKYQMCMVKHRIPNTRPRHSMSFENMIGMALHQTATKCLGQEQLIHWISLKIPGYDCEGWESWFEDELHASSFFEQKDSDLGQDEWTFREGCADFFDKRDPKVLLIIARGPYVYKSPKRRLQTSGARKT